MGEFLPCSSLQISIVVIFCLFVILSCQGDEIQLPATASVSQLAMYPFAMAPQVAIILNDGRFVSLDYPSKTEIVISESISIWLESAHNKFSTVHLFTRHLLLFSQVQIYLNS